MRSESLDCLLIYPPFVFPNGFYAKQRAYDPPLMLMALASYVRENGYSVQILDCNTQFEVTGDEFEDYFVSNFVNQYKRIGAIGLSTTTPTINASFRISEICKKYYPDCTIVLGGAHASFMPNEALDRPYVDIVCIGEGEDSLKEILDKKPLDQINGIAFKKVNPEGSVEIVKTSPRKRIKTLDELPMPAYDLIDMNIYRPIIGNFKRLPAMMVISSRGCPWSCNFCRRPVGRMWTYRSAQSLYDEFKVLSEKYGVKDIAIMDDVFTVNKERVSEFCELLIKNPLDIKWLCFARVDIVNLEMLKNMKEAGCWGIMYGGENFNQEVLDGISKGVQPEDIYNAVEWSRKADLETRICMMVGNPGDTREVLDKNIEILLDLDPDFLSVGILTPFPGHDIYNWAIKKNLISTYDWDLYFGSTPIVKLDTLTPEEITRYYRKMTFKFYFRYKFILRKFLRIRTATELWVNVKGFLGLFNFLIEQIRFFANNKKRVDSSKTVSKTMTQPEIDRIKGYSESSTKQTAIT
ncbi:MAG: radical SAM protein [Bacteroidetes bacterium]|nr:radical SAM protein [Bacteroidota bacterium]